jgi:DNA-binding transcriptional regulator/RsmH inhibitor MraZ
VLEKYSAGVTAKGDFTLPPKFRKELHKRYGFGATLALFGAQFIYICEQSLAPALIERIDKQLTAAYPKHVDFATNYLRAACKYSATQKLTAGGQLRLPLDIREMLGVPSGGMLTILGVGDYMELWNTEVWEARRATLLQSMEQWEVAPVSLLETPICMQTDPCSLLKDGQPDPRACGPCQCLRLP